MNFHIRSRHYGARDLQLTIFQSSYSTLIVVIVIVFLPWFCVCLFSFIVSWSRQHNKNVVGNDKETRWSRQRMMREKYAQMTQTKFVIFKINSFCHSQGFSLAASSWEKKANLGFPFEFSQRFLVFVFRYQVKMWSWGGWNMKISIFVESVTKKSGETFMYSNMSKIITKCLISFITSLA